MSESIGLVNPDTGRGTITPEFDTVTANEGYIDTVYLRGDADTGGSVRIAENGSGRSVLQWTPDGIVWNTVIDQDGSFLSLFMGTGVVYLAGNETTDDSLRITSGDGLIKMQKRISGIWTDVEPQATTEEVTAGTATAIRKFTPAQLKLAAETHGSGGGGAGGMSANKLTAKLLYGGI